jgi:hypothetical protein
VNLRLGGAEVYAFNRSAWGVDLVEGAVRIALGLKVAPADMQEPRAHLASTALNAPRSGIVRRLAVGDEIAHAPELAELVIFRQVGDRVVVPPRGYDYLGWMAARGASPAEAQGHLERLARGVICEIEAD